MTTEEFLKLVEDCKGFEVTLGFRDDEDHFIGGKENTVWYFVKKKSSEDYYVADYDTEGKSKDTHYTKKKKVLSKEKAEEGSTMERILGELAIGHEEIAKSKGKPIKKEIYEHPCSHYSFGFGERAYVISDEYGITVEYSNIKDVEKGFRLRDIETGKKVSAPARD